MPAETCPHDCPRCRAKDLGMTGPFTEAEYIKIHGGIAPQEPGPEKPAEVVEAHDEARAAEEVFRIAQAAYIKAFQDARKAARRTVNRDGSYLIQRDPEAEAAVREARQARDEAEVTMKAARAREREVANAWERGIRREERRKQREAKEAKQNGSQETRRARRYLEDLRRRVSVR